MNINIAVPSNRIFDRLAEGEKSVAEKFGVRLIRADEKKCNELMLNNLVDAALLSPIGYGMGVKVADYRVIEGPSLTTLDYTEIASILFRPGSAKVEVSASPNPDDFIIRIGNILLAERYNLYTSLEKRPGSADDILKSADAAIVWGKGSDHSVALDISEDWYDTFDIPLPLAFWTCRAEEYPENIVEIVNSLNAVDKEQEDNITEGMQPGLQSSPRSGKLIWHWNPDSEEVLDQTLEFLYFHQFFSELPAVKILKRD